MARKTKAQLKKERNTEAAEWIAVVILAAMMILSLMRSGIVGIFFYNAQRYLLGSLYWVVFLAAVAVIFRNKYARAHGQKTMSFLPLILAAAGLLMLMAYLSTASAGMELCMHFAQNIREYFGSNAVSMHTGGGIAGAFLYGISSMLFARTGTLLVIIVLFIISLLLVISTDVLKEAVHSTASFFQQPEEMKEEKKKREEEENKEPEVPANFWTMMADHKEKKEEKKKQRLAAIEADEKKETEEEEKEKPLQLMGEEKKDTPHMTHLLNIRADGPTEEIPVVSIPGTVVSDHASPFINVDDLIDHNENPSSLSEEGENTESIDFSEPAPVTARNETAEEKTEKPAVSSMTQTDEKSSAPSSRPKTYKMLTSRDINRMLDARPAAEGDHENETAAAEKGQLLISILKNFDIEAELIDTHIGPAVTQFEIKPAVSVKISRILGLADNIKMALAAKDVRIEAPIPGRNAVGIEIPNVKSTPVKMRELINSPDISEKDRKDPLMFYLGKDLLGRPVTCRLDKMPHLLIAGATGSGKSVCMNSIITSLLLRTNPEDVKMLLVDPKKVEFTPYKKIPHLIGPVINDPAEASTALKIIAQIMDERYNTFAAYGVRNIEVYNQKVLEQNGKPNPDGSPAPKKMPYIVVIIDELADLMLVAGKEVEASIQRITQLARAAGIHLIVATQRPSVDVITGIIKANIPSRIAFAVSSGTDSRTILDHVGAERLLGNGDMLYMPIGQSNAIRVQGVFVTDDEVKRITDEVSKRAVPMYDDKFVLIQDTGDSDGGNAVSDDPLFDEVKDFVIDAQKASTSLLQRRFGIGYNRAARMIDSLEENGIIGPAQGSRPREVYIKPEHASKKTETGDEIQE